MFARITDLFSIHKRGQGTWSRGTATLGILAMGIYGGIQTWEWLVDYRTQGSWTILGMNLPYVWVGTYPPFFIFLVFMILAYVAGNTTRAADLLIETEIEMRKVTWPTTREVLGATVVVIVVVMILGLYLFGLDKIYELTFLRWLGLTSTG